VPPFVATPAAVARAAVRAIVRDKAEIAVLPGPGRTLRAFMDRYPGAGPAMNRVAGANATMLTVTEYREHQAQRAG
jgi:hypothetical protein